MLTLPVIQLFPSLYCNLKCPYCSQIDVRKNKASTDCLYLNKNFLELLQGLPKTHFYISGGEPLIQPGLKKFLTAASANGHKVSFDTNGVVSSLLLEEILSQFPHNLWGFFNISHHILAGVSIENISKNISLLRRYNIQHFVKYVGTPGELDTIAHYMEILRNEGTGVMVTILETYNTPWQGRCFPAEYTNQELTRLLSLVTLKTHALQFFGGVKSKGRPCFGGNSYITYNMKNRLETTACCHSSKDINWSQTVFQGAPQQLIPCHNQFCLGDLMYILGIQNLFDEKERFSKICNGDAPAIGLGTALQFIEQIEEKAELVLTQKFHELSRLIYSTC